MLKGSTWIVDLVSKCDDFEDSDVTRERQSRDVIDDVTNRRAVGTFV